MRRALAWLGGGLGLAALWRFLSREHAQQQQQQQQGDPAAELRARLEQAREAAEDRDEFDAAEGQPVDEVDHARQPAPAQPDVGQGSERDAEAEPPQSLEERRRAIHEKAQEALGEMHRPGSDE